MAIHFTCAACGNPVGAPDEAAGKFGRCPKCRTQVYVPREADVIGRSVPRRSLAWRIVDRWRNYQPKRGDPPKWMTATAILLLPAVGALAVPMLYMGAMAALAVTGVGGAKVRQAIEEPSLEERVEQLERERGR